MSDAEDCIACWRSAGRFVRARQGGAWQKGVMTWREQDALCISVPFTWLLGEARGICYRHPNERIVAGGPAVRLMPDYLADVAEIETLLPSDPLRRANPDASRTTCGCPNSCAFCGVRRFEVIRDEMGGGGDE